MKRGSGLPCRVYSYGCKVWPEDEAIIFDQLRAANRYYNALVALERDYRAKMVAALLHHSPDLREVTSQINELEERREKLEAQIKQANSRQRKRGGKRELNDQLAIVRNTLRTLYPQSKKLRAKAWKNKKVQELQDRLRVQLREDQKAARRPCTRDDTYGTRVLSGTYLHTEKCFEAATRPFTLEQKEALRRRGATPTPWEYRPHFRAFRDGGVLAVEKSGGMAVSDVLDGQSTLIQFANRPDADHNRPWVTVRFRLGGGSRKDPQWASLKVRYHRPLPDDARIKGVRLVAQQVGVNTKWLLQFTLEDERGFDPLDRRVDGGVVAVDVGWRFIDQDHIRVASWMGDDGRSGHITIPAERIKRARKVRELLSIRSQHLDAIKAHLIDWCAGRALPEWLENRLKGLPKWRSHRKLYKLALYWKEHRFKGDLSIFTKLEAWRKREEHLVSWEAHQRRRDRNWRQDMFRNEAAELSRHYATVIVENVDWAKFQKALDFLSDAEITSMEQHREERRRLSGVSYLTGALKDRFTTFIKAPPEWTTQACHECRQIDHFNAELELEHTCSKCGAHWDQDFNACRNLLRFAGEEEAA